MAKPTKAERADSRLDKSLGIKEGSKRDNKIDRAVGVPIKKASKKK